MLKPAAIAAAILFCRPAMPLQTAMAYAQIVSTRSAALGIDPLMVVAYVSHESEWVEGAISKDREDVGLGQIRARYLPPCVADKSPALAPSPKCAAERKRLFEGAYNLQTTFRVIEAWQTICKQKTGTATEVQWLTAMAGLNRAKSGLWCGMGLVNGQWSSRPIPSVVRAFLQRRRHLRLRLEAQPPGPN